MEKEKRLSDSVADEILNMITIEKRFRPGDKLPNENELSTTLQISRTTLREAIRILATNGILEIQRGRGTFVAARLDVADNVMLGGYSETALSGVAAVNQIQFILQQLVFGISNGMVVLASQFIGIFL